MYDTAVTVLNDIQKPSWRGYLNKSQLITEAQLHCDTSFTVVSIQIFLKLYVCI